MSMTSFSTGRLRRSSFAFMAMLMACALAPASSSAAPPWPQEKPITWIVGFPPGGTMDTQARAAARLLSRKTGQPVVIKNVTGVSGELALHAVISAPADGYTVTTVVGPSFSAEKDAQPVGHGLHPVALLSQGPMVLAASMANNPPADLQALLAEARSKPDAWSYATSGLGTPQHLAGGLLNKLAGTRMLHVPYKGGGQAIGDVVSGQVPLGMLGAAPLLPHIKSGKVRAYAVTSASRLPGDLSDVPTMQEAGIPGYDISLWFVLAVHERVPSDRVAQLNRWFDEIMHSDEMQETLRAAASVPGKGSPAAVAAFMRAEDKRWQAFARSTGILVKE